MEITKIAVLTGVLLAVGIIYNKYIDKWSNDDEVNEYKLIEKYLLNDSSLATSTKPILWIPLVHETNGRWWPSFYSRNTKEVNQPYFNVTIKSIIDKCGDSFHIHIINDESYKKIIPGWDIDLSRVGEPLRGLIRMGAQMKLLFHYGGLIVPPSFLCHDNLNEWWESNTAEDKMVSPRIHLKSSAQPLTNVGPTLEFVGCQKGNEVCAELIEWLAILTSKGMSGEVEFSGTITEWLVKHDGVNKTSALEVGVCDGTGKVLGLEEYLGQSDVKMSNDTIGIAFPAQSVLERVKYQWFARMSPEQAVTSNTYFGSQLLKVCSSED